MVRGPTREWVVRAPRQIDRRIAAVLVIGDDPAKARSMRPQDRRKASTASTRGRSRGSARPLPSDSETDGEGAIALTPLWLPPGIGIRPMAQPDQATEIDDTAGNVLLWSRM